jgi:hypothetical protein
LARGEAHARVFFFAPSKTLIHQDGKTSSTVGTLVSSLHYLEDIESDTEKTAFFVFPDISVRMEGAFRFKMTLYEIVG